jgi:diacylglycerol kinase family enzyme
MSGSRRMLTGEEALAPGTVRREGPMPVLLNPKAGSAARARSVLRTDRRFRVREVDPGDIAAAVREERERGAHRLLICGGDGTLSAAVGAAAGTTLEIAAFPGGTLNHFARDFGIPVDDPAAALDTAVTGTWRSVDVGTVNGHIILNTSAVGAYPEFVRRREHLEQRMNYPLASVAAAADIWRDPQVLALDLETADGRRTHVQAPLLFVGVHERALDRAGRGMRRPNGARALHLLVVTEHDPSRIRALAARAAARGIEGLAAEHGIESCLTSEATVVMPEAACLIAIDGELLQVTSPLRYRFLADAVRVVAPMTRASRVAGHPLHLPKAAPDR